MILYVVVECLGVRLQPCQSFVAWVSILKSLSTYSAATPPAHVGVRFEQVCKSTPIYILSSLPLLSLVATESRHSATPCHSTNAFQVSRPSEGL